ncbi:hypothetical protein IJJ37_03155 [Candidatus Saccharibacteria bacterium]|nr:hypothetical protein [Candidatus Saccharibacteria bacterium]
MSTKKSKERRPYRIIRLVDTDGKLCEMRLLFNFKLVMGLEKLELYELANEVRDKSNGALVAHLDDFQDGVIRFVYNRAVPNQYNVTKGVTRFRDLIRSKMV